MVWFSEDVLSTEMIFSNYLAKLRQIPLEGEDDARDTKTEGEISPTLMVSLQIDKIVESIYS